MAPKNPNHSPQDQPTLPGFEAPTIEFVDVRANAEEIARNAPKNPYAAQEDREECIVKTRGEDLRREQTGIPSTVGSVALSNLENTSTGVPDNEEKNRVRKMISEVRSTLPSSTISDHYGDTISFKLSRDKVRGE